MRNVRLLAQVICLLFFCACLHAQSVEEKVRMVRAAAEAGKPKGQYTLGMLYRFGIGVPQDDAEANKWILKSAEQGDPKVKTRSG